MSLIKTLLVVGVIAVMIAEAPVIWKKQSAGMRKQIVAWMPKAFRAEGNKPKVEKVIGVSKQKPNRQKPKVYESQGNHGEVEFSDEKSVTAISHVRVVDEANGITLYTNVPDKKRD